MATNDKSSSGLWFLIGAVIVAVAAIIWYLGAGGDVAATAPAGDTTSVTVTAPAADTAADSAPAATDAPAGGATATSTTTTTTTAPSN
ncbi:hypothetical protein [Paracoccus luteus]|uniref:hypothetical protein n=1 Tax=Paracoccus luteus TaxID=2508543 RepID=UPI001070534B|nr:hypothetical protein [Paracoccus luteus]